MTGVPLDEILHTGAISMAGLATLLKKLGMSEKSEAAERKRLMEANHARLFRILVVGCLAARASNVCSEPEPLQTGAQVRKRVEPRSAHVLSADIGWAWPPPTLDIIDTAGLLSFGMLPRSSW